MYAFLLILLTSFASVHMLFFTFFVSIVGLIQDYFNFFPCLTSLLLLFPVVQDLGCTSFSMQCLIFFSYLLFQVKAFLAAYLLLLCMFACLLMVFAFFVLVHLLLFSSFVFVVGLIHYSFSYFYLLLFNITMYLI